MSTYNIWRISEPESWVSGPIDAESPKDALLADLAEDFSDDALYSHNDIFIVASEDGGHREAKLFKINKPEHNIPEVDYIEVITV